jgi:phosphotriesterase-related protein
MVTVCGPVVLSRVGSTLPHEHVLCDFGGADVAGPHRYDAQDVVRVMQPYLDQARTRGITAFVDCSPAYLGRDAALLRRLSELTGIHILTNTGYYGAAKDKYLPPHAHTDSADALAARWIAESEDGIDGTDVRPGFIKIGVDAGPLDAVDRKVVVAAVKAHQATGLAIACHTGEAAAALGVIETALAAGLSPEALIVVHVDAIPDPAVHTQIAQAGVWVELDGVRTESTERHVGLVTALVRQGFCDRILLSHDAGWYNVGQPEGGTVRPYTAISDTLLPALGPVLQTDQIGQIVAVNPARAFRVRTRPGG